MASDVRKTLQEATKGLLYSSETDSPIEVISWNSQAPNVTAKDVLSLAGKETDSPIEEISLDDFFDDLTEEQDWHDDEDRLMVKRFRNLLDVLNKNLTEIHVFRIGETEIDIYVVGRTTESKWEGIKATSVET
jgi:hypothetical protein